jgi:4-hydroxythreonine-4-phosphate dehydrogenase
VHGVARPTPPGLELQDAETDADLDAIVAAAPPGATLVGSAGLAAALGRRLGAEPLPPPQQSSRGLLIAVGTRAAGEQLERLAATGVPVLTVEQAEREPAALTTRVVAVAGRVPRLAAVVAAAPRADLVLTGGETARRTLEALGVRELAAVAQIHHGAVQCRTPDGRMVTTRPGSFGGPDGLVRIVEALT